jgi:hypothetical protein
MNILKTHKFQWIEYYVRTSVTFTVAWTFGSCMWVLAEESISSILKIAAQNIFGMKITTKHVW